MIELVTPRRGAACRKTARRCSRPAQLPQQVAPNADVAPIVRGACSLKDAGGEGAHRRMIAGIPHQRRDPQFRQRRGACALRRMPVVITPDYSIRTKNWPLILPAPEAGKLDEFKRAARAGRRGLRRRATRHISRATTRASAAARRMLDPLPRVVLVPGLGLFGLGRSAKDARIAADLAEAAVATITDAEAIGRFQSIAEADMFDCEYWPIEQAKLGKDAGEAARRPDRGDHRRGRRDRRRDRARVRGGRRRGGAARRRILRPRQEQAKAIGGAAHCRCLRRHRCGIGARRLRRRWSSNFGGVDIVVSNAGAAWQGRIGEVDEAILRKSFELNFFGHQRVAQAAVKIMLAQGTGGCLLFNVSKQAVNPGPELRPLRPAQGRDAVAGAAIRGRLRRRRHPRQRRQCRPHPLGPAHRRLHQGALARRAASREKDYMSGNLLGREVTADDVAQAFLHQALELKTTGDVTTVDGGNIAAALR